MKIVLATTNLGKKTEIEKIFAEAGIYLDDLNNFPPMDEIIEDGQSFTENALIKAKAVSNWTALPALADDSGLEVEYLNNEPGIYSARYADDISDLVFPNLTRDEKNIAKLLSKLKNVPLNKRQAKYRCSMVLYYPDKHYLVSNGELNGLISTEKHGTNGFGYDPVFYLPDLKKNVAELSIQEKNQISHRFIAALEMLNLLCK